MNEFKQQLIDYFDAWDLTEFLQISTEEIVDAFPEKIEECQDDLQELMDLNFILHEDIYGEDND